MFNWINTGLGWIIQQCYHLTHNYALALFLFALVMQIILFPLGIKQQKNSVKQAKLSPKEKAIRKKYAGRNDKVTQQKMQNEIMELYQRENFSPFGGCLPLLIQLPILFALFNVITQPLSYICNYSGAVIDKIKEVIKGAQTFIDANLNIDKLTQIDLISWIRKLDITEVSVDGAVTKIDNLPNFNMFGNVLDLSQKPWDHLFSIFLIVPILTVIVAYGSQWLTKKMSYNPNPDQENSMSMKIMSLSMPLISLYISFIWPAMIGLYWVFRNILSTLQQFILSKMYPIPKFTEEDFKAAEKEFGVKEKKEKKEKVRSLHRIDDDDYLPNGEPKPVEKTEENSDNKNADGKPALKKGVSVKDAPVLKDDSDRRQK